MKQALIYFSEFAGSFGGSEYLPLLFAAELQRRYEVTIAVDWLVFDPKKAVAAYELDLDVSRIKFVGLKPTGLLARKIDSVIPVFTVRRLKKLARGMDVCISCANMIDFGRPAHHFIYLLTRFGDNAFNDYYRHAHPLKGLSLVKRRLRTFLAETILRPLLGVRSARRMLADPRERFYATSDYVAVTMKDFYGPFVNETFYPPTVFEIGTVTTSARDPLKIVYLGRVTDQKKIREMVEIVSHAREKSGLDLTFDVAGYLAPTDYVRDLRSLSEKWPWFRLVGERYGDDKRAFLQSGTFAIHACRYETFGISVTEYLKAGLIPIVPDEGGAREVVGQDSLCYHTDAAAADLLSRLATDESFRARMAEACRARAARFSRTEYMQRQNELLGRIAP